MGIYRAVFQSIEQTEPLTKNKVRIPVMAMGGVKGLGAQVSEMLRMVAADVKQVVLDESGHFVPEEQQDAVVSAILALNKYLARAELPKAV